MAEYIEREQLVNELEALIKFTKELYGKKARVANAKKVVELLKCCAPAADVVEVVRCKDCVRGTLFLDWVGNECVDCMFDDVFARIPNDFCSYGERRKEE